jgi:hypothetical protein
MAQKKSGPAVSPGRIEVLGFAPRFGAVGWGSGYGFGFRSTPSGSDSTTTLLTFVEKL